MSVSVDKNVEPFNVNSQKWKMTYLNNGVVDNQKIKEQLNLEETERELAYAMQKAVMFPDIKSVELHFFKGEGNSLLSQVNLTLRTEDVTPSIDGKTDTSEVGECRVIFSREKLKNLNTEEFIDFAGDIRTTASWNITDLKNLRLHIFMKGEDDYVELNNESITDYLNAEPVVRAVPDKLKGLMRAYIDEFTKDRNAVFGERILLNERMNSTLRCGYVSYWTDAFTESSNAYYVSSLAKNLDLVENDKRNLPVALNALGILMEFAPAQESLSTLVNNVWNCLDTEQEKKAVASILYQMDKVNPQNNVFKNVEVWDEILNTVGNAELLKVEVIREDSNVHYVISEDKDVAFGTLIAYINTYKVKSGFSFSARDVIAAMLSDVGLVKNDNGMELKRSLEDAMLKSKQTALSYSESIIGFDGIVKMKEPETNHSESGFQKIIKMKLNEDFDKLRAPEEKAEVIKDFLEKTLLLLRHSVNLITNSTSAPVGGKVTTHFERNDVEKMYHLFPTEQEQKRLNRLILDVASKHKNAGMYENAHKPTFKL